MSHYSDEKLLKIKKELNVEDKIVILVVARAIFDKGVREYYEVAKQLKVKYENIVFLYVGDTDEGNHSCASKEFLQSGEVRWLGHRDDIVDLTAICDIYVLPSYREGLPATLMEASSMAKPMVTTVTFGCCDVVDDGVNGFLVPTKDSKALAKKLEILIQDESLRNQMGQKAIQKALDEFEVRKVVEQYMAYYEVVIRCKLYLIQF